MAKVNLLFKPNWVICQKATFLNFMAMRIRKPENEDTWFREYLNKIDTRFENKAAKILKC